MDGVGNPITLIGTSLVNVGLVNATTTISNDSIKITGQASALGIGNIAYFPMPSTVTSGLVVLLNAIADVTIKLTGADWGADTKGDLDATTFLRVYAINDNGTLKFGVGYQGGRESVVDTDTSTTQTNITQPEYLLVNSALSAGPWPCREIGYFYATFDDTGGAAENLWAVQTGVNQLRPMQSPDGLWQNFNTTPSGFSANPTWNALKWTQRGKTVTCIGAKNANGTSNATTTTFTLPVKAKILMSGCMTELFNNGAAVVNETLCQTRPNSVTMDLYINNAKLAWTNVNAKGCSFFITYECT